MSDWSGNTYRSGPRADVPIALLAGFVAVIAIAPVEHYGELSGVGGLPVQLAVVFTLLIAVGELARVRLPNSRVAAPMSFGFAAAYALIYAFPGGVGFQYHAELVIVVATAGASLGALVSALASQMGGFKGPTLQMEEVSRRILSVAAIAGIFGKWHHAFHATGRWEPVLVASLMMVAAIVGWAVDVILLALVRASALRAPLDRVLKDEFRESIPVGVPIASSAVLMALATPWMGWWAIPIFSMPVLLSQFAYSRYARVVGTNESTIRALARVTELGGYTELQHADRVAELSRLIGLQVGLSSRQQLALERAALMHDIGQLALAEAIPGGRVAPGTPYIPGGATILLPLDQQLSLAQKGAAIVRDAKFLDDVAELVEHQVDPYRARGGRVNENIPLGSRIIKVANAYDDLVGGSMEADRRLQAVARLREGSGYEYDPQVVDVLAGIVAPRPV